MEGDERLRLFVGFPLDRAWCAALAAWQQSALGRVPELRLVPRESFHVTLSFIGSRPRPVAAVVDRIVAEAASAARPPQLKPARYRETRSAAMVVLADPTGRAAALQDAIATALDRGGIVAREPRAWLPHVTVARVRTQPPRLVPPPPPPGPVSPSEVALYNSVLRPHGAQYQILVSAPLGG